MTEEATILFYSEKLDFQLDAENAIRQWLKNVISQESATLGNINYIFMSDEQLLEKNIKFLKHDYYTDILSFQMNTDPLEGDIFISVDRVKENAQSYNSTFQSELLRVIVHGLLHFIGYKDKSKEEIAEMRKKEDHYLSVYTAEIKS